MPTVFPRGEKKPEEEEADCESRNTNEALRIEMGKDDAHLLSAFLHVADSLWRENLTKERSGCGIRVPQKPP
jgi:hypothetical protein